MTFDYNDYLYANGLAFPTTPGGSGPAYYGANVFVSTPKPGFFAFLALGLTGLLAMARCLKSA